jgi:hypothetical protein
MCWEELQCFCMMMHGENATTLEAETDRHLTYAQAVCN